MTIERRISALEREPRPGWPGPVGLVDVTGLAEEEAARVIATAQAAQPPWRPGDGIRLVIVDAHLGDDEDGAA